MSHDRGDEENGIIANLWAWGTWGWEKTKGAAELAKDVASVMAEGSVIAVQTLPQVAKDLNEQKVEIANHLLQQSKTAVNTAGEVISTIANNVTVKDLTGAASELATAAFNAISTAVEGFAPGTIKYIKEAKEELTKKLTKIFGNTTLNTETFIELLENFRETHTAEQTLALYKVIITHYTHTHKLYGDDLSAGLSEVAKRHAADTTKAGWFMDSAALYEDKALLEILKKFAQAHSNEKNGALGEGAKNLIETAVLTRFGHEIVDRKAVEKHIYDTLRNSKLKDDNKNFTKKDLMSMKVHHAIAMLKIALRKPIILAARFFTKTYVRRNADDIIATAQAIVDNQIKEHAANKGLKATLAQLLLDYNATDKTIDKTTIKKVIEDYLIQSGLLNKLVDHTVNTKLDKLEKDAKASLNSSFTRAKTKAENAARSIKHTVTGPRKPGNKGEF